MHEEIQQSRRNRDGPIKSLLFYDTLDSPPPQMLGFDGMEPFKNLLGYAPAKEIGLAMKRAEPKFPLDSYLNGLKEELEPLELKARGNAIANRLNALLPAPLAKCLNTLTKTLQTPENKEGLSGFQTWPLATVVVMRGLKLSEQKTNHMLCMKALLAITEVSTAEFAIRPFLIHHETRTLKQMRLWTKSKNEHHRRLASEGTRPLLPWGEKLMAFVHDPKKTLSILEALKLDDSLYVRKSVANHLNDHSKNHPDWVASTLQDWQKQHPENKHVDWIIKHATRTLVKKGHVKALALHGMKPTSVKPMNLKLKTKRLTLGESFIVEFTLINENNRPLPLILDHEFHFLKSNGKHGRKVFKGIKIALPPKQKQTFTLRVPIKPVTTRTYYTGTQRWALLINGAQHGLSEFTLKL